MPAHGTFEWGYRRGAPEHNREEYLSQKDHTFKAKVSAWAELSASVIVIECHNCHGTSVPGRLSARVSVL